MFLKTERNSTVQTKVKKRIGQYLVILLLCFQHQTKAQDELGFMQQNMAYADVRALLINKGWMPLKNLKVEQSSLYAQEIYDQGYTEVVDCISMALDGCKFRFKQKNTLLEVNTITRQLLVESHFIKKLR
jgi:hypothetical protein